jgi:hypothetical protein
MVRRKYDSSTNVRRMHSQLEAHASSTTQHGRVDSLRVPHAPGATIACCCCSSMGPRSSWRTISPCRPHGHAPHTQRPLPDPSLTPAATSSGCLALWRTPVCLGAPRLTSRPLAACPVIKTTSGPFPTPVSRSADSGGLMLEGVPSTRKLSCGRWPSWQSGLSA